MHFNLRRAVAVVATPLLGGGLAVAATALPAAAATWQDTALVASHVAQPFITHGAMVGVVVGPAHHVIAFNTPPGEEFILSPAPLHPVFTQGTTDVTFTESAHQLVITSGPGKAGSGTLVFTIKSANPAITYTATETVAFAEDGDGHLAVSSVTSAPSETVHVDVFNNNATGAVRFFGTVTSGGSGPVAFSQRNLPVGLVSGNPLVPGSAVPRLYTGIIYTATDALGSTFSGTFWLNVFGHVVVPPPSPGNFGDMVNPFGNGFDVFQQHQAVNAIIVGWTATQADPATHFIRLHGTVAGAWRFEYAPHGIGTGLSVSDPGFDAAGTGLTDGLVLRGSNNGPWQQFFQLPNGLLKNVATGLIVNPNGTGQQLRGGTAPTPWGGSFYTWTDFAHLPA